MYFDNSHKSSSEVQQETPTSPPSCERLLTRLRTSALGDFIRRLVKCVRRRRVGCFATSPLDIIVVYFHELVHTYRCVAHPPLSLTTSDSASQHARHLTSDFTPPRLARYCDRSAQAHRHHVESDPSTDTYPAVANNPLVRHAV